MDAPYYNGAPGEMPYDDNDDMGRCERCGFVAFLHEYRSARRGPLLYCHDCLTLFTRPDEAAARRDQGAA